jgi:hypothetical protein
VSTAEKPAGEELSVLAYFHYAMGILIAMVALVPGVFVFAGSSIAAQDAAVGSPVVLTEGAQATAAAMTVIALLVVALGALFGALVVYGGRCLARRRNRRLCLFTSCLVCLFVPLGTLLGVITLSYLSRPAVRSLFTG